MSGIRVLFDPRWISNGEWKGITTILGPGGMTQPILDKRTAIGVARALGVPVEVCEPGTTNPTGEVWR